MLQALLDAAFPPVPAAGRPRHASWPWLDRAGRFSALKAAVLGLLIAPAAWVAAEYMLGLPGPEPDKAALKEIGSWTIRILLLALAVTPAAHILAAPRLATLRRMVGLAALGYGVLHLALYAVHQNLALVRIASEIVLRPYLTIGFVALLALAALGWTSTDGWMRRLGRRWKRLHRIVFPVAVLGVLHFFLQSKAQPFEAVVASGLLAWLLAWRALGPGWRARPSALLALAPVAVGAAAGLEYAWYALATNLPAERVLLANLDVAFGQRPAVLVGVAGLAAWLLALVRRIGCRPVHGSAPCA